MLSRVGPRVLRQVLELGTYEMANGDQAGADTAAVRSGFIGHCSQFLSCDQQICDPFCYVLSDA